MTQDDIISMAREVGMEFQGGFVRIVECVTQPELERFAALVAAAEREACAQVCDAEAKRALWNWENDISGNKPFWNGAEQLTSGCADAIRARSQQ